MGGFTDVSDTALHSRRMQHREESSLLNLELV